MNAPDKFSQATLAHWKRWRDDRVPLVVEHGDGRFSCTRCGLNRAVSPREDADQLVTDHLRLHGVEGTS